MSHVITTHHTNDCNAQLELTADERDPDAGNASHEYRISFTTQDGELEEQELFFQHGPIAQVGVNGITNEVLLAILIDRLEGFQSSKYACDENARALTSLREAFDALEERTRKRLERGVEGTHEV